MRWLPVVLVLAGVASADPLSIGALRDRTRSPDGPTRAAAAEQLAKFTGSQIATGFIASAAISDDPAVRGPLIDALVREGVLPKAGAIHVPTASVMARMLPRLYPKRGAKDLPEVRTCTVLGGTERGTRVGCAISRCESIMHVTITFEITTGVRWSGAEPARRAVADGSCGDVM